MMKLQRLPIILFQFQFSNNFESFIISVLVTKFLAHQAFLLCTRLLNLKSNHVSFEISVPDNVHLWNFDLSFPADSTNGSAFFLKGNTNSLIFHRLSIKAPN